MPAKVFGAQKIVDHVVQASYWTENWLKIGWLGVRRGPWGAANALRKYPWMWNIMMANRLLDMVTRTRSGPYMEANAVVLSNIVSSILGTVNNMLARPRETVLHEDLIPPEILKGMGLNPWMAEFLGIIVPLINTKSMEHYIDVAENEGIPPDVCSLPKSTMGLVLEGEMPQPIAAVASNMPCDGGMSSYALIEREMKVPTFRLDVPYDFYSERAVEYFVGELKRMIAWLEEHTPGRMDWDRLRAVCDERNQYVELEYELWDMLRERPAPMAAEAVYLNHLMWGIALPGDPRGTNTMRKVVEFAREVRKRGGAVPNEKYRVILWNPPTLIFPELFVWAEQAYGAAMIMDMLTYHRHPFIDTSTPDTMLRGLSQTIMQGPMARHTRGPAANFFGDLFHMYERFDIDMIWMAAHIGCKNTQALMGMFREKCRERGIPLLAIDYDLSDTRIVPPEDMRGQVERFMETVMKAERLDK
ncbi:2-hydroxyacyl-CoA dehydratase subunit D [bacterium]